jgi:hypothetical protein
MTYHHHHTAQHQPSQKKKEKKKERGKHSPLKERKKGRRKKSSGIKQFMPLAWNKTPHNLAQIGFDARLALIDGIVEDEVVEHVEAAQDAGHFEQLLLLLLWLFGIRGCEGDSFGECNKDGFVEVVVHGRADFLLPIACRASPSPGPSTPRSWPRSRGVASVVGSIHGGCDGATMGGVSVRGERKLW